VFNFASCRSSATAPRSRRRGGGAPPMEDRSERLPPRRAAHSEFLPCRAPRREYCDAFRMSQAHRLRRFVRTGVSDEGAMQLTGYKMR